MPEPTEAQIEQALRRVIHEHDLDSPDVHFYSPKAWAARHERFGNDALLTMTFEGPVYDAMQNNARFYEAVGACLDALGLWFDLGFAWSLHVYPSIRVPLRG